MSVPGLRVLLVDDDALVLRALAMALRRSLGCEVASFTNGATALEHARDREIDVAIVDLHMPGIAGAELMQALRHQHPGLPIVLLTGGHVPSPTALGEVPDVVLQKPLDAFDLAARVRDLVARAGPRPHRP